MGHVYNSSAEKKHQSLVRLFICDARLFLSASGSHGARVPRLRRVSILLGSHGAPLLARIRSPGLLRGRAPVIDGLAGSLPKLWRQVASVALHLIKGRT